MVSLIPDRGCYHCGAARNVEHKEAGFAGVAHDPMTGEAAEAVLGDTTQFFATARTTILHADAAAIITPRSEYSVALDWIENRRIRSIIGQATHRSPMV